MNIQLSKYKTMLSRSESETFTSVCEFVSSRFKSTFCSWPLTALSLLLFSGCATNKPNTNNSENDADAIAGAVSTESSPFSKKPTLFGVSEKNSCQLDNQFKPASLKPRKSSSISAGNIVGVAVAGENLYYMSPQLKGYPWSPIWLIAEPPQKLSGLDEYHTFSSEQHATPETREWVQIELKKAIDLTKVVLHPRGTQGSGFPVDFQILLGSDGKNWKKVIEQKDFKITGKPVSFSFPTENVKFVRILATKLRKEAPKVYYFQLRGIEAIGTDGQNYALENEGAVAIARKPLTDQSFDYERFWSHVFDAGVKWIGLDVKYLTLLKRKKQGLPAISDEQIKTIDYLRANGVKIVFRLVRRGAENEMLDDPDKFGKKISNLLVPVVKMLKGKVAIWLVPDEDNMYGAYNTKKAIDRHPGKTSKDWKKAYVTVQMSALNTIRKIDPGIPVGIATALFDFGWTKDVLEMGLADKIDFMGVHVYKEENADILTPEMASTYIRDGIRGKASEKPYPTYQAEIQNFQKLLHSFNPKIKMIVDETCVNVWRDPAKPHCMTVSELSQAKFLARLYLYNQFYGVCPTLWWTLNYGPRPTSYWGLLDTNSRRRAAWKAMRNVAAVTDNSYIPSDLITLFATPKPEKFTYRALKKDNGQVLIPFWAAVPMRDSNTGVTSDLIVKGIKIKSAEAVDMLKGTVQQLKFEKKSNNEAIFKGMIVRDYPIVLRLTTVR